jgi:hypothetical protein
LKANGCPAPAAPINPSGASGSGSDEGSNFVVCEADGSKYAWGIFKRGQQQPLIDAPCYLQAFREQALKTD